MPMQIAIDTLYTTKERNNERTKSQQGEDATFHRWQQWRSSPQTGMMADSLGLTLTAVGL